MITKNDVKKELINVMSEQHINILIDFANNFINTFGNRMTKEELLNRINKLNYIGFERKEYIDERCGNADAEFISSYKKIIISEKHKESSLNIIKSLLYHELIHAISYHKEKDLDTINNQYEIYRTGLRRDVIEFDPQYEGPGFNEGELLEEIMTEYYNTIMLKNEGIDFNKISIINDYCLSQDYVEYHGTGYGNIAALGQIYDYLFGENIFKAKFYDGNDFREKFNNIFNNTNIFNNYFIEEGYKVPSYSKFVAQRNTMERYRTACHIFIQIFKEKNNIRNINELLNNNEFNKFLNMLVKTRNKFDESTKINNELYMLTKELAKDLVNELFGNKIKDSVYGIDTEKIESSLFLALEKIYSEDESIDLKDVKYAIFYDENFKGIYLIIGTERYIIDYKTLGQNISYAKLNKFSESGFTQNDIEMYSKEYKMDVSNAEYATIKNPAFLRTFIMKDYKLYNYRGEEINIGDLNIYNTNTSEYSLSTR